MRFKKLRIAWSVWWGVVAVLLIGMWVRSYGTADRLQGRFWDRYSYLLASKEGRVAAVMFRWHGARNWTLTTFSYPVDDELSFPVGPMRQYEKSWGFGWLDHPLYMVMRSTQTQPNGQQAMVWGAATATLNGAGPIIRYWFLVVLTGLCGIAPWIRRLQCRFSLRTLLITTTLIALALGTIVWLAHR